MKITDIADLLDSPVIGDSDYEVKGVGEVESAEKGDLVFLFSPSKVHKNSKRLKDIAAVIPEDVEDCGAKSFIRVKDPKSAIIEVLNFLYEERNQINIGIAETARTGDISTGENVRIGHWVVIEDNCVIGDNVTVMPFSYIGRNVQIGENTRIFTNCSILEDTVIGRNVVIHSGTVVGSSGFGYHDVEGRRKKIPHVGDVVVEDEVEIGSLCTIDRGTLGSTVIGEGTKIDTSVHIAHNVKIGKNALIVAQVGIAGSTDVGDNVRIAGKAGISDHLTIGDGASVMAASVVIGDVDDGAVVFGYPAEEKMEAMRNISYVRRLPEFFKRIKKLEDNN